MNDRTLSPAPAPARAADERELGAEHRRLARYVASVEATDYQISKYVDFHQLKSVEPLNDFDRFLLRLSRSGVGLSLADAYTGTLYRSSIVRVKLMITIAILECSPPSFGVLDKPEPGGGWVFVRMALRVSLAALLLFAAMLVIVPAHVWCALTGRTRRVRAVVV
jgi:hypothetical protein